MPLTLYPDPVLLTNAFPVAFPLTPENNIYLERVLAEMQEVMLANKGIGLAANQVGCLMQVIVLKGQPFEAINPTWRPVNGTRLITMDEGCLSQPGRRVAVERYEQVWIEYDTRKGKHVSSRVGGMTARVWQHECDHLIAKNIGQPDPQPAPQEAST